MSKKLIIFAVLALALVFALSACERSASNAALPTSAATNQEVVPTSSDPMAMLRGFATQTAQALSGGFQPTTGSVNTPVVGTPVPGVTNSTPAVGVTPMAPTSTSLKTTAVPAANSKPVNYTLQEGEYPYCIARRFNVNPDELLSLNGLTGGGLYVPGLVLKIPQTSSTFPGPRSLVPRPASYTVAAYDTVYKIACKYGDIDPITIASANNLVAPYTLKTGQTITIP